MDVCREAEDWGDTLFGPNDVFAMEGGVMSALPALPEAAGTMIHFPRLNRLVQLVARYAYPIEAVVTCVVAVAIVIIIETALLVLHHAQVF